MGTEYEIPETKCDTAEQLLDELDEIHPRWRGCTWIFRGQNDADWLLHPRAMRSTIIDKFVEDKLEQYNSRDLLVELLKAKWEVKSDEWFYLHVTLALHVVIEREMVSAFKELADQAGLVIPNDRFAVIGGGDERPTLHDKIVSFINHEGIKHRPAIVAYALAQHHGIPTRLLDWTYRPLFAAFFAAFTYKTLEDAPSSIVVWAVKRRCLGDTALSLVTHLRSQIGFLQSQDGVFLYDKEADTKFMKSGQWQPFEGELLKIVEVDGVYKFALPFSQKDNLLELLRLKRISKSFLMPSFDNVAEEIMEQRVDWKKILDG